MFSTLVGSLPAPPDAVDDAAVLRAHVRAQIEAGIDLLSAGEPVEPTDDAAERWRALAELVTVEVVAVQLASAERMAEGAESGAPGPDGAPAEDEPRPADVSAAGRPAPSVKAALLGPFTLDRGRPTRATVGRVRRTIEQLVAAGCPFVELHEPAAVSIGTVTRRRDAFRDAVGAAIDGVDGHVCLAFVGGDVDAAGAATLVVPGVRSLLFDLILGPENWRAVVNVPGTLGVVLGAVDPRPGVREVPETAVWAAQYAASTQARGMDRVGLATAGTLASLPWATAIERLGVLGRAARIAALPPGEALGRALDPRAVDIRSAAFGRYAPMRRPGRRPATPAASGSQPLSPDSVETPGRGFPGGPSVPLDSSGEPTARSPEPRRGRRGLSRS